MKEKDAKIQGGHHLVLYVEKDDTTYGPLLTGSYMSVNYLDDYLEKHEKLKKDWIERLLKGEASPVAFHMMRINIAEADLACRVGISRRALKKHLKPEGMAKISLELALKYAEIFGIPLANLFQVILRGNESMEVEQEKTKNPLVVATHIGGKNQ